MYHPSSRNSALGLILLASATTSTFPRRAGKRVIRVQGEAMGRIQPHIDNVIDISDSDDEQAVTQPVQPQTRPFIGGNKRPNIPWQAPVAPSGMVAAAPSPVKPVIHEGLESISSDWAPAPAASPIQRTAITCKPLMKSLDPVDLTLSSDEDETATILPSPSACCTNPAPRPHPRFIQPSTRSPPFATSPLPIQKGPPQGTPTHKRAPSPTVSPGLRDILVPGPKKRKRQIGGYQPGLLGFNDDHGDSTSNPTDTNPDLFTRKRPRLSIDGAKSLPAPAENVCIRGLAFLKKAAYNDIGKGAPNTGPKVSGKENKVKEMRKKRQNKVVAPTTLKRSYLPPCEEPEKVDAMITPTDINNILRTVISDNEADEACMDIEVDMSGDPPPRGRFPTPVQHLQTPQTPPLAREEVVASHKPSRRVEWMQEVINTLDFNLFWDEENDADHQLALQLDCELQSSPTHPTVSAPSVIDLVDAVDFDLSPSRVYPYNLPYGGVPGVGASRECHDLVPYATEAVSFTGEYLYGPSKKTSDIGDAKKTPENQVQDPFAPDVVDLYRQTIQESLRVWAENPRAGISPNLTDDVVPREELAVRVEKREFAEGSASVSRPHEKGDIEKFIEIDLKAIPRSPEGTLDEEGVVPESPEVQRQSTPEELFITQVAITDPSGVGGSGNSELNITAEAFAIVDSDMKASDEGVGANHKPSLFAAKSEPQEPTLSQRSTPRGIHISIIGSECAHQEPTAPSKRTVPTSRTTRLQSRMEFTEPMIGDLESLVLKRLNLTPKALAPPSPPVWEVLAPLRYKKLYLSARELARWERGQEPKPDVAEDDGP